eukprot:CAMPEP_0184502112 /NCGR_PEP_ID=MMETSP0113_2-20130426/49388_1 /TAXON_ID=91329 /ORGANISM="Norrisiella sphaerica, Strain BC52" /LENGTH=62 /DNA_ID=CAMNT_0026891121 /DNA_START=91 /DNA_END=276 /DNA_ORIENTATION=-
MTQKNKDGMTPTDIAAKSGHMEIARNCIEEYGHEKGIQYKWREECIAFQQMLVEERLIDEFE